MRCVNLQGTQMKATSNFMPPTTIVIHQTKKIFLQSFPALNKSSNFIQ